MGRKSTRSLVLGFLAGLLLVGLSTPSKGTHDDPCSHETIGVITNVYGTNAGQTCDGSSGEDHMWAYGGADFFLGLAGPDEMHGGAGDDRLKGNEGDDRPMRDDSTGDDDRLCGGRHDDFIDIRDGDTRDRGFGSGGADTGQNDPGEPAVNLTASCPF